MSQYETTAKEAAKVKGIPTILENLDREIAELKIRMDNLELAYFGQKSPRVEIVDNFANRLSMLESRVYNGEKR